MAENAFRRARGYGRSADTNWTIEAMAILAACIVPLLIIDLGLAIQLLVNRSGNVPPPQDWVMGSLIQGRLLGNWPWFGSHDRCFLAVVALGGVLAVLESFAVWAFHRSVHAWALRTCGRLKSEIHSQAFRLGPNDLLSDSRSRPEELFSDTSEALRRGLVTWRLTIPRAGIGVGLLLILALAINVWLTLLAVVLAFVIWRFYARRRRQLDDEAHAWQESANQTHQQLLETFRLAPLISGYSLQATPGEPFEATLAQYERQEWRAHATRSLVRPLLVLTILAASALFVLAVGLRRDTSIVGSSVLITALLCAYFPAWRLYRLRDHVEQAETAAREIFAYLDREPSVGQVGDAKPLERLTSEVRLENVILADRSGRKLIDGASVAIPAGQRVAILASDRGTPMALAGLFVRYYDPAAGRVLFDGREIRRATLDTVRGQALFVPRDGSIFSGTIADNLACGDAGFTTLQITDVAKRLGAFDFIQQLPQGFATLIGRRDLPLRMDQCFRLGVMRALLREPSILVLEEPPNDVDEAISGELDALLAAASVGRTVIILASRLATLRSADYVYVFHEGRLHAQGTHADLLQASELYRHLIYVRFNPFRDKSKLS